MFIFKNIYDGKYLRYYKAYAYSVNKLEDAKIFYDDRKMYYFDDLHMYKKIPYITELRKQKLKKLQIIFF